MTRPGGDSGWTVVHIIPGSHPEAVVAALFEAGAQGVQEMDGAIVTHAPTPSDAAAFELAVLAASSDAQVETAPLPDVDWSEEWKRGLHVQQLGALAVAPPWLASGLDAAHTIVIDPGMAFGTGEHATTRGVIRLLQRVIQSGDRVADLGAGSAVLGIAAAKLGASHVAAIEIDPDAIGNAEENVTRNGVGDRVIVIEGDAATLLPLVAPVRVITANIISSVLIELLPVIASALDAHGRAILSGILVEEREMMARVLTEGGWHIEAEDREEGLVERDDRGHVATFLTDAPLAVGSASALSESAAHHARVKRLEVGDVVRLTNGEGLLAQGAISTIGRGSLLVDVTEVERVPRPSPIHLRAPVADRDRMLWLAEKAAELGVTSWQAVRFQRSASVSPRGEGSAFVDKVRARMIAAVEQSGGAWLPTILPDTSPESIVFDDDELPILLDPAGAALASVVGLPSTAAPVLLLGPEGGLEKTEAAGLLAQGWRRASLASTTLRFETAGVAAVAVCRALRLSRED